jgi:hypothetical protein
MAQLNFDAAGVAPNTGQPDPIPAGWYNAAIDESEMKPTKDGAGTYLQVRYSVLDGQYAGRKVYDRLNLRNSNPQAQEIAYGTLSAICHATGVIQVADSQQFHGIPLKIKVKVSPADGRYEASNEVKGVASINEQVAGVTPNSSAQQQAQQQPWQAQQQAPVQQTQAPAQQRPPVDSQQQTWQAPAQQQPWQQAPVQQQPQTAPVQQQQPASNQGGNGMPPWATGQG